MDEKVASHWLLRILRPASGRCLHGPTAGPAAARGCGRGR